LGSRKFWVLGDQLNNCHILRETLLLSQSEEGKPQLKENVITAEVDFKM
jgi:hypothetical protein